MFSNDDYYQPLRDILSLIEEDKPLLPVLSICCHVAKLQIRPNPLSGRAARGASRRLLGIKANDCAALNSVSGALVA